MRFLFKLLFPLIVLLLVTLSLLVLQERKEFDIQPLVHIDPLPYTKQLIVEKKYVEAENYLNYFMDYDYVNRHPESKELLLLIKNKRSDYAYKADKFFEGIITGGSDEEIGKATAIASDFLVIGDIRDLSIEGTHYLNDEKVDKVILALSSLGLAATASTIYTLGATAPIKTSISVLKYGKKINKIPTWLNNKLIEQAKIVKDTKSLKELQKLLDPINKLYKKVGLTQTLNLLKQSRNINELTNIVEFSSRFGKKSTMLLHHTHYKALSYAKQMPNVSNKTFLYASTYGEKGLKGLKRMGENKFMKRLGFQSNLIKTTYKGNFNPIINWLLKKIPSSILYIIAFLGLFYFIRIFLFHAKNILTD